VSEAYKRQSGFTLIEVLIASVVMTVGVFSILAVFPQSLRMTRESGHMSVLNHLAAQQVEYLRSVGYGHTDMAIGTHPTIASDSTGKKYYPVSGLDEEYSMRWIVSTGPTDGTGTAEASMKTVTIEATYLIRYDISADPIADPDGIQITFTTFVSD
jgi:prepilin-type N-terminal cleavage/methylation domain-containing protein